MNTFEISVTVIVLVIMVGGFIASQFASRLIDQDTDKSNE
jgi:hypothetical protein